ncbi:hypothetical protein H6P81_006922 [Aristolochia fimbriata]|uniref:Uncharacterized protein n=1 Tax=Aristolochia fimbriata TaxID=158543 RepID=A0AAV7EZ20_ARIFI|nr:hypothetical protein H6P81_006922 [Aristolochia fimbriata]
MLPEQGFSLFLSSVILRISKRDETETVNDLLVIANGTLVKKPTEEIVVETPEKTKDVTMANSDHSQEGPAPMSERRKALFEPLEPVNNLNKQIMSNEMLLPPPDFDSTAYPKGWLVGKKRKLVNVDVVESARETDCGSGDESKGQLTSFYLFLLNLPGCDVLVLGFEVQDWEIDGLNEQLEGDARCLEHLQLQLLEEGNKRTKVQLQLLAAPLFYFFSFGKAAL